MHVNQLVIIDEASMVSTYQLAALADQAQAAGAKVLLVGDPAQLDSIDAGGVLGWLDRTGHAARLTTIHRFSHTWERQACLQLRNGDFDGISQYEQHDRIRSGSYNDMVDTAYAGWDHDLATGRSAILIAPDNETVSKLNQRAQADRIAARTVDASRTTALSDGARAGRGDVVLARQNCRHLLDSRGDYIRNGTLLTMAKPPDSTGGAIFTRQDTGATVHLASEYLAHSVELGYATTAHRAQGVTVDASHSLVSEGTMTRELFYVSMTRGTDANTAYVVEPEPDDVERLDPTVLPHWPEILGRILAAEGAERTAHETRQHLTDRTDTLAQLAAEHDYLTQIAAGDQLSGFLAKHAPERVAELQNSPSWGPAVAMWKRLAGSNPALAERTVLAALTPSGAVRDQTAILHSRLSAVLGQDRHADSLVHVQGSREDIADMLSQVEKRLTNRTALVASRALAMDQPWQRELARQLKTTHNPNTTRRILQEVGIFRDQWGIANDALPLGTQHDWEDFQMSNHRQRVEASIALALRAPADTTGPAVQRQAPTPASKLGMGM